MLNPDIELLFGVQGDGDISSGSGKEILTSLNAIIANIEKTNPLKVKIHVDENSCKIRMDNKIQK